VLGLVVGKPLGIAGAGALAVRLRIARLPAGAAWSHLVGTAAVGGIGFTVSLFVTELAFDRASLVGEAKVGILAASLLAGVLGFVLLRRAPERPGSDGPGR
jgi:Na+:H+ antiporter, NhaA family